MELNFVSVTLKPLRYYEEVKQTQKSEKTKKVYPSSWIFFSYFHFILKLHCSTTILKQIYSRWPVMTTSHAQKAVMNKVCIFVCFYLTANFNKIWQIYSCCPVSATNHAHKFGAALFDSESRKAFLNWETSVMSCHCCATTFQCRKEDRGPACTIHRHL